jgi:hypothetical protein
LIVTYVPIEYVNAVWSAVAPLLEGAVRVTTGRYTVYDVYTAVQQSRMQLWIAVREDQTIVGAQITQITDYPSKRMLTSMFTGGSAVRGWRDLMMARLEDWARANQCAGIEGEGRAGWVKLLERYGVKQRLISYEKDL